MALFCKDCAHLEGTTCNRPIDLGPNLVTGEDDTGFIAGLDAHLERRGGKYHLPRIDDDIDLCGAAAQFFVAKT